MALSFECGPGGTAGTVDNYSSHPVSIPDVQIGDRLDIAIELWDGAGTAPPAGAITDGTHTWTLVAPRVGNGSTGSVAHYTAVATINVDPLVATFDPPALGGGLYGNFCWTRIRGGTTEIDVSQVDADGDTVASSTPGAGTLTPTATGDYVVCGIVSHRQQASPATVPSVPETWADGFSQSDNSNHIAGAGGAAKGNGTTPITPNFTTGGSNEYRASYVIYKESASAGQEFELTASGRGVASADLATAIEMGVAGSGAGQAALTMSGAAEFALTGIGAGSLTATLEEEEYPNEFLRIDDDNSVFIDLPSMPAIGWTIFVMMDAWQWTTPPAGQGVDPQSSWLTDNNGASAGDYQREAIVLATDGRAQVNNNTPGVAIFRRVVTSVSNSPYRITAAGGFDWGGIAVLAVPGVIDAPPQDWSKDWRPTVAVPGIPPDITFGSMDSTTDYAIQIGVGHNGGHGDGIDGPGEGTVGPPRQTGMTFTVIAKEGHNSNHLAFHAFYRIVRAIETMAPLMALDDPDGATFTYCRGVQAVYGLVGGEGAAAEFTLEAIGQLIASHAITTSIVFSFDGIGGGQASGSLTATTEMATAGVGQGTATAALTTLIEMAAAPAGAGIASADLTTAVQMALDGAGAGLAAVAMGGDGSMALNAVATAIGALSLETVIALALDAQAVGQAAAELSVEIVLALSAGGALEGSGSLATGAASEFALAGTAAGVSSAALDTAIILAADAAGIGVLTGALQTTIDLAEAGIGSLVGLLDLTAEGAGQTFEINASARGEAVAALETLIAMAMEGSGRLSGQADVETSITLSMAAVGELIGNPNLRTVMPRVYAMITAAAVRQGRVVGTVTIRKIGGTLEVLP